MPITLGVRLTMFCAVGLSTAPFATSAAAADPAITPRAKAADCEPSENGVKQRNDAADETALPLGLEGFSPVTLVHHARWEPGRNEYSLVHNGRRYLFKSESERKSFRDNPEHYVPVLNGFDGVELIDQGREIEGRREHGLFYEHRIYLFASERNLRKFGRRPIHYSSEMSRRREPQASKESQIGNEDRLPANPLARGMIRLQEQSYREAIVDFSDALRQAHLNRSMALLRLGRYDDALEDLNELIRADSQDAVAFAARASAWVGRGNFDIAIQDYTEAIRLGRKGSRIYVDRGTCWCKLHEFDKAIEDFNGALDRNPGDINARLMRGSAYNATHDFRLALLDFSEAVCLRPNDANVCYKAAWFLATCPEDRYRNGARALALANAACEISRWENPAHREALAAAAAEQHDFEMAITQQLKAVEMLSGDSALADKAMERLALFRGRKVYREQ